MAERVRLHGMAYGGAAVGRLDDGAAVFVPGGLPGETVSVQLAERKRNFARGRLEEVLDPAPERIAPPCPHFLEGCGGCQWQYASYEAQVSYKQQILSDQLRRSAGIAEPPLLAPVASPRPFGYRNVAEFHLRPGVIGFHREGSHELVDIAHCPLVEEPISVALAALRGHLPALAGIESVQVRRGSDALQLALHSQQDPRGLKVLAAQLAEMTDQTLQARDAVPPASNLQPLTTRIAGVRIGSDRTRGLSGPPHVLMPLAGRQFRVSAQSFFQVNSAVADELARAVATLVQPGDRVLDLFSGVGTFALLAADRAAEVVGVEAQPSASADAAANQAEAAAENVRFLTADVAASGALAAQPWDLAILDPPRAGCPHALLEALNARRVAYVSCDPSTLARDLRLLVGRGYALISAQLFDMFPQTYHLETLALLERL